MIAQTKNKSSNGQEVEDALQRGGKLIDLGNPIDLKKYEDKKAK